MRQASPLEIKQQKRSLSTTENRTYYDVGTAAGRDNRVLLPGEE